MLLSSWKGYIIPGLVFQSVMVAGGYGTGREFVEYFLSLGPKAGFYGILVAGVVWSVICAVTFEYARRFQAHDYRTFFQGLLGKGWIVFEISYIMMLIIVLGVIGSSAGSIVADVLNVPYWVGTCGLITYILVMVIKTPDKIENELSFWSLSLYVVFIAFFALSFSRFGGHIQEVFFEPQETSGWLVNGLKYASYNLGFIPGILFATRHIQHSKQAVSAGVLAGIFGILPGIFFYFAMVSQYPLIVSHTVPSSFMLKILGYPLLTFGFYVVLFATLVATGTGLIHAFNERFARIAAENNKELSQKYRILIALMCMLTSIVVAQLGLKVLIAKGYGLMSWVMLICFIGPILTTGLVKIFKDRQLPSQHAI